MNVYLPLNHTEKYLKTASRHILFKQSEHSSKRDSFLHSHLFEHVSLVKKCSLTMTLSITVIIH